MGVEDGAEGAAVAGGDGAAQGFAFALFLADAFVDKDVGIHGHASGQHDAGDAGQGQGGADRAHHAQENDDVGDEGDIGDHARDEIVKEHEGRDGQDAKDGGPDAAVNRVRPHGRVHLAGGLEVERGAQRVFEDVGEV